MRGLALTEPAREKCVSFAELYVNFQLASIFHRAWVFKEISLREPFPQFTLRAAVARRLHPPRQTRRCAGLRHQSTAPVRRQQCDGRRGRRKFANPARPPPAPDLSGHTLADLEAGLLGQITVTENELRALMQERARTVEAYLLIFKD